MGFLKRSTTPSPLHARRHAPSPRLPHPTSRPGEPPQSHPLSSLSRPFNQDSNKKRPSSWDFSRQLDRCSTEHLAVLLSLPQGSLYVSPYSYLMSPPLACQLLEAVVASRLKLSIETTSKGKRSAVLS